MNAPGTMRNATEGRSPRSFLSFSRRPFLACLLAAALLSGTGCGRRGEGGRPPNLLLVTIDTMRWDRLGCTGHAAARTPVMDRLASEGVLFDCCIVPCPITLPSHASLMTGRLPFELGVRENRPYPLPASALTLAEVLASAGYATAAVVSGEPLAPGCGLEQGFGTYRFHPLPPPGRIRLAESPADRTTAEALETAGAFDPGAPFFLWVHYYDPHFPYEPPEAFRGRGRDPYDGEIAFTDRQLGVLLDGLRERGLLRHTLVAVTSDHGEGLGEHGEATHAYFLYDTTLRVPLILRGPGLRPRGRVRGQVRLRDLGGALLHLLGVPGAGKEWPGGGEALAAFLSGARAEPPAQAAFSESLHAYDNFRWAQLTSLRTNAGKLVRGAKDCFFDLERDPSETHPLPADRAGELAALMDRVKARARCVTGGGEARIQRNLPGYFGGSSRGPRPFLPERENRRLPHPLERAELVQALLDAVALQASGGINRARAVLEELTRKDPANPAAAYWLARVLHRQGEREGDPRLLEASYRAFGHALELDPRNEDAFHMRTWCLIQLGRFARAEEALRAWTRDHPAGAKTLELYGYLYGTRASGDRVNPLYDPQRAFASFDRSLELNRNNPFLLQRLVSLAKACGFPERAERYAALLQRLRSEGWR